MPAESLQKYHELIEVIGKEAFIDNFYSIKYFADGYEECVPHVLFEKLGFLKNDVERRNPCYMDVISLFDNRMHVALLESLVTDINDDKLKRKADEIISREKAIISKTQRINFSDYFKISQPRKKCLSELDRENAYYLPPPLLSDDIMYCINNPEVGTIPRSLIDDILVVEFQRYDTMVDKDGNEYDWSNYCFQPMGLAEIDDDLGMFGLEKWFEKRLSAVNHILLNNKLDIEASVIYNLFEIRPKTEHITADYLRYYFQQPLEEIGEGVDISHQTVFIWSVKNKFYDEHNAYYYSCEDFTESRLTIDCFDRHAKLVEENRRVLDEMNRGRKSMAIKAVFGQSLYNNLVRLENRILTYLDNNKLLQNRESYSGFVTMLEDSSEIFDNVKKEQPDISTASIFGFAVSLEVILRAKLMMNPKLNGLIHDKCTLGHMLNCLRDYPNAVFKRRTPDHKTIKLLRFAANKRNHEYAHTGRRISISDAEEDIALFCDAIRCVDESMF